MQDVSGFGFQLRLVADKTFPLGFTITEFSDDADPFDLPVLQIADAAMGLNGDLITWSKANPLPAVVSVIPESEAHKNMAVLFEANRPARGKRPAKDIITLVGIYPNGSSITLSKGIVFDGLPGKPVASSGRLKTVPYNFRFEQMVRVEV